MTSSPRKFPPHIFSTPCFGYYLDILEHVRYRYHVIITPRGYRPTWPLISVRRFFPMTGIMWSGLCADPRDPSTTWSLSHVTHTLGLIFSDRFCYTPRGGMTSEHVVVIFSISFALIPERGLLAIIVYQWAHCTLLMWVLESLRSAHSDLW
jgi:hypothetical protein